ncbi:MAG TPA: carboxypeptidase-like regulatory domain-containing protein, partial [Pedobacter sp.]
MFIPQKWFVTKDRPYAPVLQKMLICCCTLILLNFSSYAQTVLHGVVSDNEKNTLIGVTVNVTGTAVRAMTDANGKFTITAPATAKQLTFSYVGLQTQTVDINGRTTINITLSTGTDLDVVNVVGYGSVKKSDLTGAATTVSAKDFNKGPLIAADQLIQGKVAGVQMINNSGQPGGASTVRIRGNTAMTGTGQPLYIVDGVALDGRSARPSPTAGSTT